MMYSFHHAVNGEEYRVLKEYEGDDFLNLELNKELGSLRMQKLLMEIHDYIREKDVRGMEMLPGQRKLGITLAGK